MMSLVFFNTVKFNKSLRQFFHLNALYPLVSVSSKKDGSCLSFKGFLFSGHVTQYQIWS